MIEEPVHRLAERLGHCLLEQPRVRDAADVIAHESPHQRAEPLVVPRLEIEQQHPQHVQDERPLLVGDQPVVERRISGPEAEAGHHRSRLVAVALPDYGGPEAVPLEAQPLADTRLAENVEAPRVEHVGELLLFVESVEHIQRGCVVGEPFRDPLIAVALPVDPRAPPLVRHLVRAKQLRLAGVQVPERLERE